MEDSNNPTNWYDFLSLEGLSIALRNFLSLESCYAYQLDMDTEVHPYIFTAIFKGVILDSYVYDGFIKMQDKFHQTIARQTAA